MHRVSRCPGSSSLLQIGQVSGCTSCSPVTGFLLVVGLIPHVPQTQCPHTVATMVSTAGPMLPSSCSSPSTHSRQMAHWALAACSVGSRQGSWASCAGTHGRLLCPPELATSNSVSVLRRRRSLVAASRCSGGGLCGGGRGGAWLAAVGCQGAVASPSCPECCCRVRVCAGSGGIGGEVGGGMSGGLGRRVAGRGGGTTELPRCEGVGDGGAPGASWASCIPCWDPCICCCATGGLGGAAIEVDIDGLLGDEAVARGAEHWPCGAPVGRGAGGGGGFGGGGCGAVEELLLDGPACPPRLHCRSTPWSAVSHGMSLTIHIASAELQHDCSRISRIVARRARIARLRRRSCRALRASANSH